MIKVKDLLEALKKFDPELPVIAAADDEGNSYHPADTPGGFFCPELDRHYIEEVYPEEYFDDARDSGHEPVVNCVML